MLEPMLAETTPQLSSGISNKISSFQSAEYIPQSFSDSTHKLWRIKTSQEKLFLKVCNNTRSPFWQIMLHLFGFELGKEIALSKKLYPIIANATQLQIPKVITAESTTTNLPAYILTSELDGGAVEDTSLTMVTQLAQHLGHLHQQRYNSWGTIQSQPFNPKQWPQRLTQTLSHFNTTQNIPTNIINHALTACSNINCSEFIPMMPDLRWDQFLQQNGELTALVDLDAFILAPRELDFVLLEHILTPAQLTQFVQTYSRIYPVPLIDKVRPAYRLLLFLMQISGKQEIRSWMATDHFF